MTASADLARQFLQACKARGILVATAESCTGGGIIALLTDMPGSSAMVDRGFVTYSNEAKMDMLGVRPETLEAHGAVSAETVGEMAAGALRNSRAGVTLAVTGIAGPDGGSPGKPVGLVWFGIGRAGRAPHVEKRVFENLGRDHIRRETARVALELGLQSLDRDAG
jgi:nicotinamide-nucleotide amidase